MRSKTVATPKRTNPPRVLTPLWIVALFVSLTETVVGVSVVHTSGQIQLILTIFATSFPVLVAAAFFWILYTRPFVFYPPADFRGRTDVKSYVEVMRGGKSEPREGAYREALEFALQSRKIIDDLRELRTKDSAMLSSLEGLAEEAASSIEQAYIAVDSSAVSDSQSSVVYYKYESETKGWEFLEIIASNVPHLNPERYGKDWVLRDRESGATLNQFGGAWRERGKLEEEAADLKSLGISSGTQLEVIMVGRGA
jgi:hypothetical protein